VVEAVRRRSDAGGVNVGLNLSAAAGQTIAHLHWHIIARTTETSPTPPARSAG